MIKSRRYYGKTPAALSDIVEIKVRFGEVDALQIVWHGEYVKYLEDGRESFGNKYQGIGYLDIFKSGYSAPIVDLNLQFLHPLTIGDTAIVETHYIETEAATIYFEYEVKNLKGEVMARGSTTQAFVDADGNLCLKDPQFYKDWKQRWLNK